MNEICFLLKSIVCFVFTARKISLKAAVPICSGCSVKLANLLVKEYLRPNRGFIEIAQPSISFGVKRNFYLRYNLGAAHILISSL